MSYVPGYLEFLSRQSTADGWPNGVDEAGKLFAIEKVQAGLAKFGQMSLDMAKRCIYDHIIDDEQVPGSLTGIAWDWLYAVTYRALLAVDAQTVFIEKPNHIRKPKTTKEWQRVPVSRADVEALVTAGTVTVGVTGQRVRALAGVLASSYPGDNLVRHDISGN